MAWPLTPLTTYLSAQLPWIKAADLNAIQNAINRGFLGTYSYAGLVLDGAGGNTVAPAAGSLTASGAGAFAGNLSTGGALSVGAAALITGGLSAGGNASVGGSLSLGSSAGGVTLPTPSAQPGTVYKDSCLMAFAHVDATGAFLGGFGIASITTQPPGGYQIKLQNTAPNRLIAMAVPAAVTTFIPQAVASAISNQIVGVQTRNVQPNQAPSLANVEFCMLAFGI